MATLRQRKAFKIAGANGGIIKHAMIEAGYSDRNGKIRTDKLTQTKGWQELLEQHLPDKLLAQKHKAFLNKTEKIVVGAGNGYSKIIDTGQPHSDVGRGLDLAYKLKGRLLDRTDITSGGKPIVMFDENTASKYAITRSAENDSQRPAQIQDSSLRPEVRKDNTSS